MYLFSTSVRAGNADPVKIVDWALNMTNAVNGVAEVPSTLWMTVMSPHRGTLAWTSVISDLAVLEDTDAKLAVDPRFLALLQEANELLTEPADQQLMQLIHGDPDAAKIDARYATTTRATLAPGSMGRGIEVGVDLAQRVKAITGQPTSLTMSVTGDYGTVMWISLAESIQQLQAGTEAVAADRDFAAAVDDDAATVFLPGAEQTITRKLA